MIVFRAASPAFRLTILSLGAALLAAIAGCSTPARDDKNSTAERLYAEAHEDIQSGNFERAIKSLERIEARATGTLLAQQAQLEIAYAYHKSGDRVQGNTVIDKFIKLHPSNPALDYALYLKGLINFTDNLGFFASFADQDLSERDQQASRDSFQAFRQLAEQFPQSKYTPEARVRMDYISNSLADYELHVARYYYRRGAYVAAANRAQQAIQDFPQAPATEEALYILSQSYERLGLKELQDSAVRVLNKNFPKSRFASDNSLGKKKAWWKLW